MRFYLETLGCPKNLVDGQGMARLLRDMGHEIVAEPRRAQVIVVNTCGFVEAARAESIGALRRLARGKRPGQALVAAGCLSQYWGEALAAQVLGIDALLGTRRWAEIGRLLEELQRRPGARRNTIVRLGDPEVAPGERARSETPRSGEAIVPRPWSTVHAYARQGASAYVKIADGCSAPCAFCAIPIIKGRATSRPARAIVQDAVTLVKQGVVEVILIAQDTTAYGRDRGEKDALPGLIRAILEAAPDLRWLRLMYAYPGHVSPGLIEVMASDARICHYLDLPLQHAHPAVLRRMRRPADVGRTRRLIAELRAAMPDLALRSSFIVGYPGETEAEFETLLDFLAEVRFDRVGVFTYSAEPATAAAALPSPVPEPVKAERYKRAMELQQGISLELNRAQVGRTLEVLVEGRGDGLSVGRSYRDAPEIDGLVLFPEEAAAGEMVKVRIVRAMEYDLMGERTPAI